MKILKGKKLYRTGPLKLYKNGWGSVGNRGRGAEASGGGGGGGGSKGGGSPSSGPSASEIARKKAAAAKAAADKAAADKAAAEKDAQQKAAREKYKAEQKAVQAKDVASLQRVKQQQEQAEERRQQQQQQQQQQQRRQEAEQHQTQQADLSKALERTDLARRDTAQRIAAREKAESLIDTGGDARDAERIGEEKEDIARSDRMLKERADQQEEEKTLERELGRREEARDLAKEADLLSTENIREGTYQDFLDRKEAEVPIDPREDFQKEKRKRYVDEEMTQKFVDQRDKERDVQQKAYNQAKREDFVKKFGLEKGLALAGKLIGGFLGPLGSVGGAVLGKKMGEKLSKKYELGEEPTIMSQQEAAEQVASEDLAQVQSASQPPKLGGDRGQGNVWLDRSKPQGQAGPMPQKGTADVVEVDETVETPGGTIPGERGKLVEQLRKESEGKDSIAERQIRAVQDRSLKQRLAQMQSMRGAPTAAKMRMFDRASDKARREAGEQIEIAGMKERKAARDQLRGILSDMSREEAAEKWRQINFADKQKLLAMSKEEAISKGKYNAWLTVAAMGQKFFPDEIKAAGGWIGENVLEPVGEAVVGGVSNVWDWVTGAEGGYVSGPGSETSDSIPARLSDGEFVVKASAVRGLGNSLGAEGKQESREAGVDFLAKMQDKMGKKAEGGEVDEDLEKRQFFINKLVENKKLPSSVLRKNPNRVGASKEDEGRWVDSYQHMSLDEMKEEEFAKGGEAYVRPKKAFREAIGYEAESRFHDKALKDAKFGGARRKFRHFQDGGPVDLSFKPQFKLPQSGGYGSVVAAQQDLNRRLEELEQRMGR